MAYNLSPHSVIRNKPQLERLLQGGPVTFYTGDPKRLAYKLREACAAAKALPEFKEFAHLASSYIFKVIPDWVLAQPTVPTTSIDAKKPSSRSFDDASTTLEVLFIAQANEGIPTLKFPNAELDEGKEGLLEWAELEGYTVVEIPSAGVILTTNPEPYEAFL